MSLESTIQIAQLVGVLAVIASVIFLAIETRLASQGRRLDAHAIAAQQMIGVISDLKRDPDLMEIYARGLADFHSLDKQEQWRFGAMMQEFMYAFRTAWLFNGFGASGSGLDGNLAESMRAICGRPGFKAWWPAGRYTTPDDFAEYIDHLIDLNEREGTPTFKFPQTPSDQTASPA